MNETYKKIIRNLRKQNPLIEPVQLALEFCQTTGKLYPDAIRIVNLLWAADDANNVTVSDLLA